MKNLTNCIMLYILPLCSSACFSLFLFVFVLFLAHCAFAAVRQLKNATEQSVAFKMLCYVPPSPREPCAEIGGPILD